jgi:transcriptional regulator with XRE-family HTH domain
MPIVSPRPRPANPTDVKRERDIDRAHKKFVSSENQDSRRAAWRKLVRLINAFSQIERDTGISLSTLQRIAKGQVGPSIDTIGNIAHNLGCTVSELTKQ